MYDTERYSLRVQVTFEGQDWNTQGDASVDFRLPNAKSLPKLSGIIDGLASAAVEKYTLREKIKAQELADQD